MTIEEKDEMICFIKHIRSMLPDKLKDIDNMSEEDIQLIYDECHSNPDDNEDKYNLIDRDFFIILKDLNKIYIETKHCPIKYDIISTYVGVYPSSYTDIAKIVYPYTPLISLDYNELIEDKKKYEQNIKHKRSYVYTVINEQSKKYYWLNNMLMKHSEMYYRGGKGSKLT